MLGVAGKFCTGKDALVAFLRERGFHEIDVDRIGHETLRDPEAKRRVVQRFGAAVLGADGEIDRRELGRRVFRSRGALRALERIVHPMMAERVREALESHSGRVVINAALLFRIGLHRFCTLVFCVRAPLARRLAWARSRNGLSCLQILRRLAAQRGICPKLHGAGVDIYYVDNDRSLEALGQRTLRILRQKGLEL